MANANRPDEGTIKTGVGSERHGDNVSNNANDDKFGEGNAPEVNRENSQQQLQFPDQQSYNGTQVEHNTMEWPNIGGYNAMMQSHNGMPNANWNWMQNMMGEFYACMTKSFVVLTIGRHDRC